MRLLIFRSLWTNGFNLKAALVSCISGEFDGVEGPVPDNHADRTEFVTRLKDASVPFIAEIATGGGYVPVTHNVAVHIDDFTRKLTSALQAAPLFCTILGGCDAWSLEQSIDFFGRAMGIARQFGAIASFETHRSRPTFSPWSTALLMRQLPEMRLTCDFSHWCCVCERLVLDEEPELVAQLGSRTHHVHARVGYDQGPQVPNPAAPEYSAALNAHERWWQTIWQAQVDAGMECTTLTPEFGPDGYLHTLPFSGEPVASLDVVNGWMAKRQRERFSQFTNNSAAV